MFQPIYFLWMNSYQLVGKMNNIKNRSVKQDFSLFGLSVFGLLWARKDLCFGTSVIATIFVAPVSRTTGLCCLIAFVLKVSTSSRCEKWFSNSAGASCRSLVWFLLGRRSADHIVLTHCVSALLRANHGWGSHCHAHRCYCFLPLFSIFNLICILRHSR